MRTAGLMMNDVWAARALRERGVQAHRYDGLNAQIGVLVDSVELKHRGKAENYRPYLHVVGELRSITPAEPLPYGITQVTYTHGQGEKVDAFYEFDDEQLVALAAKGYFSPSFTVPDQLTGIEWELPASVDALVLTPSEDQADAPVVFMNVHRIADLEIDLASTEYDLAAYFADRSREGHGPVEAVVDHRGLRARSDTINSLFSEDELDLAARAENLQRPEAQQPAAEGVTAQLQAVEAEIAAERERYQAERERTEGTPEHLYHERVAPALRLEGQDDAPAPADAELDAGVSHDLDFGLDTGDTGQEEPAPTLEERKRAASRRAADLDFGEDDGHGLGH
ncbi:hypothetical protein ACFVVC_02330 [Pseudarthrobacter sp. NPDC058196]|uniref:hypothetical protein n=1 Tax=Pseudarthrobacter sp. NPDC058196 TaxID=3346376 RepID=UPI0036D98953